MQDAPAVSSFSFKATRSIGRALLRLASPRHQHLRLCHVLEPARMGLSEPAFLRRVHAQEKLPRVHHSRGGPVI